MASTGTSSVPLSRADTLVGLAVEPLSIENIPVFELDKKEVVQTPDSEVSQETVVQSQVFYSTLRKYLLLCIFCLAQFLDVVNNSSVITAIPTISADLSINASEQVWLISATQLAFASFLLLGGRISDVYSPKWTFVTGIAVLGLTSILMGFMNNKVALFAFRGISGAFASLTIPSALNLITKVFPEPLEQSRAVASFGASGSIGNILGLFIGAILVQAASWSWVFWFVACIATPASVLAAILIPDDAHRLKKPTKKSTSISELDLGGVAILTIALILFIYGITTGSATKWLSAGVLAPMVIAILLLVVFFIYETRIPEKSAALPPKTWKYSNFYVLFFVSLLPYFWWTTLYLNLTTYWQDVFGWTAIFAVEHQVPLSLSALAITFTGPLSRIIVPKWFIMLGLCMTIVATILLPFASTPDTYWRFVFPAFVIGSAGMQLTYTHANIAIFRCTPSHMAGTVGAIFNSALQLGSSVGSAIVTSINSTIDSKALTPNPHPYAGRSASFWFLLGAVVVETVSVMIFYHPQRAEYTEEETGISNEQPQGNNVTNQPGPDEKV